MPISVQNLIHIYSSDSPFERAAVSNVSFTVNDGEFIGIIGHTGSGKSTLIEHLNGLLKPNSGHIFIDDEDITDSKCNLRLLRSKVGLVFQYPEYQLFEETVFDDIAYGPKNLGLSQEEIKNRVIEAMHFVGLEDNLLYRSPFDLSGGQKRRVAIAGVLAMNPKILILDEPTAGLDPSAKNDLLNRLKSLHKEKKITILLVSHSMEDVSVTAEKILVMSKGELIIFDTVEKVFKEKDLLKSIGLDIPQICEVLAYLRNKGYDIDDSTFSVDKAADIIYNLIEGEANA